MRSMERNQMKGKLEIFVPLSWVGGYRQSFSTKLQLYSFEPKVDFLALRFKLLAIRSVPSEKAKVVNLLEQSAYWDS
uniref:Uncharacterized protein n=1 Tax=Romanomermis culicivorax TaxID=13658 RepID=A0A915J4J0_ROMCU